MDGRAWRRIFCRTGKETAVPLAKGMEGPTLLPAVPPPVAKPPTCVGREQALSPLCTPACSMCSMMPQITMLPWVSRSASTSSSTALGGRGGGGGVRGLGR